MKSIAADRNEKLRAKQPTSHERWRQELRKLRSQTVEARRALSARVDRNRQSKELMDATGRRLDVAGLMESSINDYVSEKFFLHNIGLWLEVTPNLAMTVFVLRREGIQQYEITNVHEMLLLDMALLGYFHAVRMNKQSGDCESLIDSELSAFDPPSPKFSENYPCVGLAVQDRMKELQTRTLPVIEWFNAMFLRNLRALRDLKQSPIHVNIQQADHVNVGQQQVNVHESRAETDTRPAA